MTCDAFMAMLAGRLPETLFDEKPVQYGLSELVTPSGRIVLMHLFLMRHVVQLKGASPIEEYRCL